jgi:large subunit ribosomal protein L25
MEKRPSTSRSPRGSSPPPIRHGGINQIFNISLGDGTETLALPKAIQRDPLKDTFEHVDLLIVRRGERVTVEVPVHLVGEAAKGTLVMVEHGRLAITADALHLPEHLEASIEGLEAGSRVTATDVPLPSGVELAADTELVIAVVAMAPTAEQLEGEVAEAEAEVERAPRVPRPRRAPRRRPKPPPDPRCGWSRGSVTPGGSTRTTATTWASPSSICWPTGPGSGSAGTGGRWPTWRRPGWVSASTRPPSCSRNP